MLWQLSSQPQLASSASYSIYQYNNSRMAGVSLLLETEVSEERSLALIICAKAYACGQLGGRTEALKLKWRENRRRTSFEEGR